MNRLETIKVADAMHEGVFTCSLHAPLTTVARIMVGAPRPCRRGLERAGSERDS